jgi:tetratricopeptide (TPR) repeat protein
MRTALIAALLCFGIAHADETDDPDPEVRRWAEMATVLHKQAQETKDAKKYEEAAGYYEKYLAKPHAHEATMAYYYAELLFHLQRYGEAAKMYERCVTVEPKGKYVKEAVYAYVISTKNASRPTDQPDAKPPCPDMKPCVIPDDLLRLVAAFERFIAVVPDSPERPNMEYRRARIFYEYQHFAEAGAQFDHVFVTYPDNELATYSANLEMDCLAILKRYPALRALVERVKKSAAMKDETTQKQVRDMDEALKKKGK